MKILFIYRNPSMGPSIRRVFQPIEEVLGKEDEVDSLSLPCGDYAPVSLWRNIKEAQRASKGKAYDIIHITGQEHYLIPFLDSRKVVVTVHDLGSILKTERGLAGRLKHHLFVGSLMRASRVTCISEATRLEVMQQCKKINTNRIRVIPNPVDPNYKEEPLQEIVGKPIILHVGTACNKNLQRVIEALRDVPCHLRIIGTLDEATQRELRHRAMDYSVAANLSDEALRQEYVRCQIVSFPSLYEGFGMPIIEAQATGRVVVTSNRLPMCDVAGAGAVLVDPESVESIREGFVEALQNGEQYVKAGLQNVRRFMLSDIVEQYRSLYFEMK